MSDRAAHELTCLATLAPRPEPLSESLLLPADDKVGTSVQLVHQKLNVSTLQSRPGSSAGSGSECMGDTSRHQIERSTAAFVWTPGVPIIQKNLPERFKGTSADL